MSGKGSKRRPAAISEEQLAANWEAVFGEHRPAESREPSQGPFDCGHTGYLSIYSRPDGGSQCTDCANQQRGLS